MTPPLPNKSIRLKAPLPLRQGAGSDSLPAQFTGIAYSGGLVASYGLVIDVASTRVPKSMPLLFEHDRADMVGVVDDAATRNSQIVVSGRLFSNMADSSAQKVGELASRGAPFQMSLGLFNFTEEQVPPGVSVSVNSQSFAGPITVLHGGLVRECSICVLGADSQTSAAFFSQDTGAVPHDRDGDISNLFAALGQVASPEERAAMRKMPAADFNATRLMLLSIRVQQSAIERAIEQVASHRRYLANPAAIYESRRSQASRLEAQQPAARVESAKPRLLTAESIYRRRRAAARTAE